MIFDILDKIVKDKQLKVDDFLVIDLNRGPHEEIVPLIELFSSDSQFDIFNDKMHFVGVASTGITYEYLAIWLIKRSFLKGAKQATEELEDYLSNEFFDVYKVMWLNGLWISSPHDVNNESKLMNIIHFPVESYNERFQSKRYDLFSSLTPDSVLLKKIKHKKIYYKSGEAFKPDAEVNDFQYFDDLRLLLTLIRDDTIGVQTVGTSIVIPDNIPTINGFSYSLSNYKQPNLSASLIKIDIENLIGLYNEFNERTEQQQDRIRIVLNRLNEYTTFYNSVDKAISIRIMLETLFLDEESQGELSYQLALRVSKLFSNDYEERLELFSNMKKVYSLCSKAVHNGRLKKNNEDKANELFPPTVTIIKKMLFKLINGDEIDWKKVILD